MADDLKFDELMAPDPEPFNPKTRAYERTEPTLAANVDADEEMASLSDLNAETHRETPVSFVTGKAGCGKTYTMKKKVEEDRSYGALVASTGIAAVNLGAQTINSLLKYYDTASLKDNYIHGRLQATLRKLAMTGIKNIILDEVSMTPKEQLDIIMMGLADTNQLSTVKHPLGLIIVGDFCQLPPVKADYAFKADVWPKFAAATTRLTKNWRQSDPQFLEAINHLRAGNGKDAADLLQGMADVNFHSGTDDNFDGTTIMAKNEGVDRYNNTRLMALSGKTINLRSRQWGAPDVGAWRNIPSEFYLKEGAYVMILANSGADLKYANGDTGHVQEFDGKAFHIKLVRNDDVVKIYPIHRTKVSRDTPSEYPNEEDWEIFDSSLGERPPYGRVSYDEGLGIWHTGGIQYYPLRPAYASTVHKSQGLSLDRCQIDIRNAFFGQPSMAYVAVSRCRTPGGLRIVGTAKLLVDRCAIDPEVLPYL